MVLQTDKLLVDFPVQLPSAPHLLSHSQSGVQHPLLPQMKLIACPLSGKPWRTAIRKDTADVIMSGWREGTKKCYHSYIKKWIKHGDERSKDPFRPIADELIMFLTSLYNQGKGIVA